MTGTVTLAASVLVCHFQFGLRKHERLVYMFTKVVNERKKKTLQEGATRNSTQIRYVTDTSAPPWISDKLYKI
jgi:hypothetical protein